MDITVYEGAPGSGKTLRLLDAVVSTPGRRLVAFPRTPLIDEQAEYCRKKAEELGTRPSIVAYHSKQDTKRGNVGRQIEDTLRAKAGQPHVVLMITHAALLELDPALLKDWHVAVDENLDASVASGTFVAAASWSVLDRHYRLEPLAGARVWQVVASDLPMLTRREIAAEGEGQLQRFLTYARNPRRAVFVDIADWQDARAGRKVGWWSIWTPLVLDRCASVTFTAAGFYESLPYRATQWLAGDALKISRIDLGARLSRACARVRVHYYTTGHVGSTTWWETDEGSKCLVRISEHQAQIGGVGYWSCNDEIRPYFRWRFDGESCRPKMAGTNSLIERRSCLFIYSSKPQSGDGPIMELLGLDRDDIRRAREFEDVRQFCMRGAIRRPEFDGEYDVYLYDQAQAEDLASYLRGIGITDVEVVPVEGLDIMDVIRPGAVAFEANVQLTAKEKRDRNTENQRRRRADIKAQEESSGIVRKKRGRPVSNAV